MPRAHLILAVVVLCLAPSCDDKEATREAERKHQELVDRVAKLEAQTNVIAEKLRKSEEVALISKLPLPPATPTPPAPVVVEVLADGLRVDGESVALERLEAVLRERAAGQPALKLSVKAENTVAHARVVEVLDRAQSAGITKIAMVADPPAP